MSTANLTWVNPTTRNDTPPTTLQPSEIASVQIYDAINGAAAVLVGTALPSSGVPPTSFSWPAVAGTHVVTVTVTDTNGDVSAMSAPVTGTVTQPAPSPATGLVLTFS